MKQVLLLCNMLSNIYTSVLKSKYNNFILIDSSDIYYIALHLRYSSFYRYISLNCIYCVDLCSNIYVCNYIFRYNTYNVLYILAYIDIQSIESIVAIYPNSSWFERECSEFFGINFINSIDTRNLLLDYSNKTMPLRKIWYGSYYTIIGSRFYNNNDN